LRGESLYEPVGRAGVAVRTSPGVTDFNEFQLVGIGRFPNHFPTKAL
jgi:hypothetical protein